MSAAVGDVFERRDRAAHVRFERRAVEDKAASLREGHYVGKDVEFALITPPYSRDVFVTEVEHWLNVLDQDTRNGRMPSEWQDAYKKQLAAWRAGQTLPPVGSPIRGWGVLSPVQQEMLTSMNILTVEDLAGINDEGMRRIGMGGLDLKNKAKGWLAQLQDKGPLTQEIASVKAENAQLKASLETMQAQLDKLAASIPAPLQAPATTTITADDIQPEVEQSRAVKKK